MHRRPHLRALAESYGVLAEYLDAGGQRRATSDETYVALLAAMGVDASTEASARQRMADDARANLSQLLARTWVTSGSPKRVAINPTAVRNVSQPIEWRVELRLEDGSRHTAEGRSVDALRSIRLPLAPPLGYHSVQVELLPRGAAPLRAAQWLIVTPPRCVAPSALIGNRKVFGLLVNLYTVRSDHNWGAGDCRDLAQLVRWSGAIGATFIGVNPLHALQNAGPEISPYNPVSRLFRNPLYLDVRALPELADTPAAQRQLASDAFARELCRLRAADEIDYERVMALKLSVLRPLHRSFMRQRGNRASARGRAYRCYLERQGDALLDFATFAALRDDCIARGQSPDWHHWPETYRTPTSAAVRRFRAAHAETIDFHCYLQFALDQQLERLTRTARAAHLPLGIYQDLAIGSARNGSDCWAFRDSFVDAVSLGAPPDSYNAHGQNWSFPPLDPQRLRDSGYDFYRRVVGAGLRHAGALRVDHILGLVRQYWIPNGAPARQGAYVRMPSADLFGILALESHRAGGLIIGEDLGTVPPELPGLLRRWGVLSTRVLYFERTSRGAFRSAKSYPHRALASANTHDLPPIRGYLDGRDLEVRDRIGLFVNDSQRADAVTRRRLETSALLRRLRAENVLRAANGSVEPLRVRDAILAFLARTAAVLVGVALDDLGGELDAVNVPGVDSRRHRSWARRMTLGLAELRTDPRVQRALHALSARRWRERRKAH